MEVKDIVKAAVIINELDTFATALRLMTTQHTNTLLVTDAQGRLAGEVTVTDLLDAMVPDTLNGDDVIRHFADDAALLASLEIVHDLPVSEFMTRDFNALELNDNLVAIAATAIGHQRSRIPVVDIDNRPIGIISRQGLKQILSKYVTQIS